MTDLCRCQFVQSPNMYVHICRNCGRGVLDSDVHNFGIVLVSSLVCGEASAIDWISGDEFVESCRDAKESNELIGQEGGRWNHLYLE